MSRLGAASRVLLLNELDLVLYQYLHYMCVSFFVSYKVVWHIVQNKCETYCVRAWFLYTLSCLCHWQETKFPARLFMN